MASIAVACDVALACITALFAVLHRAWRAWGGKIWDEVVGEVKSRRSRLEVRREIHGSLCFEHFCKAQSCCNSRVHVPLRTVKQILLMRTFRVAISAKQSVRKSLSYEGIIWLLRSTENPQVLFMLMQAEEVLEWHCGWLPTKLCDSLPQETIETKSWRNSWWWGRGTVKDYMMQKPLSPVQKVFAPNISSACSAEAWAQACAGLVLFPKQLLMASNGDRLWGQGPLTLVLILCVYLPHVSKNKLKGCISQYLV